MYSSTTRLFLFILILLPFSGWTQTDRFVTTGGTDSGDCSGAPCLTIGYAVSQASSNDNVNVGAGTFAESVVVDKSLTITGANVGIAGDGSRTAETIIDPASSAVAFTITAADVTIDGFQIGTDTSTSNASTGIDIQFTGSNIANNVIYADLAAIVIDSLSSGIVTIDNNEIQMLDLVATGANASVGVSLGTLTGTVDVDLSNNNITKASYGVFVFNANSSSRLAVDGGTFTRCTRGIQVNNWDGTNYTASNIDIQNVIMTQFIGPGGGLSQPDAHAGIYAFVGNNGNTSTDIDLAITSVDISGIGNTQTDYSAIYLADFNGGGNDVSDGIGITASITLSNVHDNFNRGIYSRGGDAVATVYRSTVSGNGFDPESSNAVGHGMYAYNGGSIVASECVIVNPSLASQAASTTAYGLSVAKQGSAYPASSIVVDSSSISTNGNGFLVQGSSTASGTVNMSGNWLGSFSEATITTNISNTTNVDISPWLGSGTDTEGGTAGFQGSFASLYVGTSGMQNGGDRIQEAHDVLVESGQITLNLADYTETLTVSKDMILAPQSTGSDTVSIDNLVINGSGKTLQIDGNLRVNSALTTTDGIIQMLNDTHLVLGSSATAPTESSTSYVQGNYNVEPRAVGTGSLDVLGVNIASGSDDLGNVSVSRVTGPEAVITDGLSTSIASVWTITADNQPAGGRNISFTWQMEHDNGKDLSSMVMMSNDGGGWVVQSAAQDVTPSPSTDPRVFPAFSVTAFSDWIAAQSDQLLPVELVSFVGNAGLQSIALQWSTATEIDADYFDVERSMNQNEFVAVGRVAAAGNSESMEYYEFVDVQVTRAVDYFYRLKQVDTDGSFEYSKVIRVTSPLASLSPLLYPNPATGSIKIQKGVDISSEAVSVLDLSGKRNTLPILERQVDVSKLLPGIYIMEIDLVGRLERLPFIKVSQ